MFHTECAVILFVIEVFKDIFKVYLACCGFIPARGISQMEDGDFAPCSFNIRDKITFRNLLMVKIIQDFAGRSVHCPADFIGLGDSCQKETRVINKVIQWFKNQCNALRFNYITTESKIIYRICSLLINVKFVIVSS